ncbi:22586_t:CDS:10 [Entrophospora sp. SA101]|nr:22586_t:CDS:10 [Entrophospora sp. SA101]
MNEVIFRLPFEINDDELGPWDVLLSDFAIRDMRVLDPLAIKAVTEKLMQISSGKWKKHKLQHTVESHSQIVPIYVAELPDNDGLKILWQVDYGFSVRNSSFIQYVEVWAVTKNQKQITDILKNTELLHKVYTSEHKHRCTFQQTSKDDIILPVTFGGEEVTKSTERRLSSNQMDDENLLKIHEMLTTNKFVPLSKDLFKSLVRGGTDFTFQVSELEHKIINHPTSAIVVGRSGTGKTTCIVFRLLASYLKSHLNMISSSNDNGGNSQKRQIFITLSENLCCRVKEHFNKLRESALFANEKMSEAQFHEYVRRKGEENVNLDANDTKLEEEDMLNDIPNSFHYSKLTDDYFPLIITYKKFIQMLQGTYGIDFQNPAKQPKFNENDNDIERLLHQQDFISSVSDASWRHFVDYNLFANKYWPHFNDYYRKNLDCGLVFSEFAIIKGSNLEGKHLSREEYQEISTKKYPAFCYNRGEIYDLFQEYQRRKSRNFDYDSIDMTIDILRCAKTISLNSLHIHELYIDECQDNNIVDLSLILKLFEFADSIFLAGDIAQCIARGSSFRFQDLKALIHDWEVDRFNVIHNRPRNKKPKQPELFEMKINYRSHNGILKLASSVIDLITHFFPDSIDQLSRECGEVGGPRPIVFNGVEAEQFYFHVFSMGEGTSNIEFGAEQVIIVRDDETRKRVKKKIGNAFVLILTVFESKGMEFNDVLLYNFFTESPAQSKWRAIHSAFDDNSKGIQPFSHEKHYILSSELKHLYVAVTRARQQIWIYDEETKWSEPMHRYWEHHDLVKVIKDVDEISTLPSLAKKSDSYAWDRRGKIFFGQKQYEQAVLCFRKSGNQENCKLAEAYHFQQVARDSIYSSDDITMKFNFTRAAEAFKKCSRPIQAASCYQDIDMHEEAGDVFVEWDMFELAANCYSKAKKWDKAGNNFQKVEKYTEAVDAYKSGGFYEIAIDLMQRYRQEIDEKTFNRVSRLANIHYRRENNKEMSEKALSILPTKNEQMELLRDHAPEELLKVFEKSGDYFSVVKELCSRGKFEEAADKIISLKNIMIRLLAKASNFVKKLRSQSLERSEEWRSFMKEFQLYLAYLDGDFNSVHKYIQLFRSRREPVAEFCAVNIFLKIIPQSAQYLNERLQCLLRLCELTFPFIAPHQSADNIEKICKDFEDIFFVNVNEVENRPRERKIFLDNPLLHMWDEIHHEIIDDWHVYEVDVLHLKMRQFLASHIFELICEVDYKNHSIPDVSSHICRFFASCQKSDCKNHHVVPTPLILHQRLKLASLNYTVIRQLDVIYHHHELLREDQSKKVLGIQRRWAEKLVKFHIRYQSPQVSCPEITQMVLSELPKHTHSGFVSLAQKIWLFRESVNADNFAAMLKCMFILQQLRDKWSVDKFNWEMSKTIGLSYSCELPIGFEDYGYHQAIPVGRRLSLFFDNLYKNRICYAISHAKVFIQYAINYTQQVQLDSSDAFGDLVSLMEFTASLIFAASPKYCDFCLPRAYLVNYFKAFTVRPLTMDRQYAYDRENYLAAINDSFNQVKQFLLQKEYELKITLRLIRLLVLIGLNESVFAPKIFNLFNHLNNKIFSLKAKKYLAEDYMKNGSISNSLYCLVKILNDDLKENGFDSLVIVYYNLRGISKFHSFESHGIVKLKYTSNQEFHSALRQIITPVASSSMSAILVNEDYNEDERFEFSDETQEPATEIQTWFQQIHNSPQANEAATKIQNWIHKTLDRKKSRQLHYDPLLEKTYNEVTIFCQNSLRHKRRKYIILLRGPTVDVIVKLNKLQSRMDVIKGKLNKTINNHSIDMDKVEECVELLEDLKYIHYENVKLTLGSLSTTENVMEHMRENIEWLKNKLQEAHEIINQNL